MCTSKITHNKSFQHTVKITRVSENNILTMRHIAGNIMTSIETENTSNKIPRQHCYQYPCLNLERE